MKKTLTTTLFLLFTLVSWGVKAQLVYHDAGQFQLLGKSTDKTETLYERLSTDLKDTTREPVWNIGKRTAGLAVRFSTNARTIGAKWSLYEDRLTNNMTATGTKGLDLYCLEGDNWVFVNSARPNVTGKENEVTIIQNMDSSEKEFMLYLPLYDGVTSLEIGVDSLAVIKNAKASLPEILKPVVAYGTSILQGGCASRPGMAHTNILSRWLNKEIINLGFSGNAQLDYEIAEQIADVDASIFILDFMPNVNVGQINEKMEKFYSIIRSKHPDTPILFVENPLYPQMTYDLYVKDVVLKKNKALQEVYAKLEKTDKNISLISSATIIGNDNEATVDGIHFTDLGFMRYAEYLYPILKGILENENEQ